MKQFVSLALLVGGVVLLTIDINATNSFSGGYGGRARSALSSLGMMATVLRDASKLSQREERPLLRTFLRK
jgi:hypothetical protein